MFITSPVKYLPKRGTPSSKDIVHGKGHLMKQLAIIDPKVVILLGQVAAEGVLQSRISVTKERGKVIAEKGRTKYFLTYHPAAALRFPTKFKKLLKEDFQAVRKLA